jgi:type I restriction enzyme S subunit
MVNNWPLLSLKEAGVVLFDCEHKTPAPSKSGFPYIAIPQMKDGHIDVKDASLVSPENYHEWVRRVVPRVNDVMVSRRCNPGESVWVPSDFQFVLGQNLVILRSVGSFILPEYLRWLVRGNEWWENVRSNINVGAIFDSLKCADIPNFILPIPPIEEQSAISIFLSTIDRKIVLNRQMNETLEAFARAVFKSWFIDFDPVRAKMEGRKPFGMDEETAALFPDSLKKSELGEIPKEWNIQRLDSLLELTYGKPGDFNDDKSRGIPTYGSNGQIGWTDEPLVRGPGIIVGRKGSSGIVTWSHSDFFPIDTTFYVRSKIGNEVTRYLYHVLMSLNLPDLTINAGVPGLNRNDAHSQQVVVPSQEIIEAFCSFIFPFIERIASNEKESRMLSLIRDTLLPKLISGEIRIPPFGEEVGE